MLNSSCFECQDGTKIHFSNVRKMEMFIVDDVPFIYINGHRILNIKHNKKVAKKVDAWLQINNYKTVVDYVKMTDDEIESADYEEIQVNG